MSVRLVSDSPTLLLILVPEEIKQNFIYLDECERTCIRLSRVMSGQVTFDVCVRLFKEKMGLGRQGATVAPFGVHSRNTDVRSFACTGEWSCLCVGLGGC